MGKKTGAWLVLTLAGLLLPASPLPATDRTLEQRVAALDPGNLELASVNAAVASLESPEALFAKNADRVVPIASITKLMTALVVLESGESLDAWLTIVDREHDVSKNAYSRIRIGSELTRESLLRITLMSSENLAAHVLASHHPGGRAAFIDAMNDKAAALGMRNTRFTGPSGLSIGNRSTARDLLRLVLAAHDHERLRDFTTTTHYTARFRGPRYVLGYGNTNPLVSHANWPVSLSKTGYLTEAGRCLAMVTVIDGEPLAMVLLDSLGSRSPLGDAGRIRRWVRTGASGPVAASARAYERERNQAREQAALEP